MAAGRLDVFEDGADDRRLAVRDAVDVQLDRVFEELVDEDGLALCGAHRLLHVLDEVLLLVDDRHAASAQDEARAHEDGVADLVRHLHGLGDRVRDAARRLEHADLGDELLEVVAILGAVDVVRRRADHVRARRAQLLRKVERGLPAELHDHAVAAFAVVDLHHVFERERFEVEAVGCIVVRRDRLRVRVHHDDLEAPLPQRERGVAAAVVELDALADAVGAAAEHHDLPLPLRGVLGRLARRHGGTEGRVGMRRVEVGRDGLELAGAGIDRAEGRTQILRKARGTHLRFGDLEEVGDLGVAEAHRLRLGEGRAVGGEGREGPVARDEQFVFLEFVEVTQEPAVDLRQLEQALDRPAAAQGLVELEDAVRARMGKRVGEFGVVPFLRADGIPRRVVRHGEEHLVLLVRAKARVLRLQRAERLLEGLLERAADGHRLADGLHLRAEVRVCGWELLERETRHLHDHIVERRLEAARRLARDVVAQLVERVADGEEGGDLRDREARRLRGERGGARDARVHLDDDAPPRLRVDGPLHVGATRRDADGVEDGERVVAHRLVFAVGERLDRRDGD